MATPTIVQTAVAAFIEAAEANLSQYLVTLAGDHAQAQQWFSQYLASRQPIYEAALASAVADNNADLEFIQDDIAIGMESAQITLMTLQQQQAQALFTAILTTALQVALKVAIGAAVAAI